MTKYRLAIYLEPYRGADIYKVYSGEKFTYFGLLPDGTTFITHMSSLEKLKREIDKMTKEGE